MKPILLIFLCYLTSYSEVPFQISHSKNHLILKQKRTTTGKLFIDFYERKRKLSEHSYSAFLPSPENLKIDLPKNLSNNFTELSAVITVLNVNYELEESKLMFGSGPGQFREGVSIRGDSFNQIYLVDTAQEADLEKAFLEDIS